jgi:hypothetical protein
VIPHDQPARWFAPRAAARNEGVGGGFDEPAAPLPGSTLVAKGPDVRDRIEDERLQRLFAYWTEKAAGRFCPARRDIDPLEFDYLLGDIALLEVLAEFDPPRFRYRVMGTRIVRRVSCDMTGKLVNEMPTPQLRQATQQNYELVTRERKAVLQRGTRVFDGRTFRYEILRLPLSDDGATVNMILTANLYKHA